MRGMREILGQLGNPSKENKLEVYKSRQLKSPVHMVYTLTSGVDGKDVFTLRKYTMRAKEEKYSNYFMVPSYFLRTANLEICRHTSFGHDYVKGDGSINDYLHRYYLDQHKAYFSAIACGQVWQPQPFSGYVCQECRLEVEIRFRGIEVEILVWQDIGASRKSNWGAKVTRLMGMKLGMESARAEERMRSGLKPGVLRKKWEGLKHKGG
jgi:hypothetical protein